METRAHDTLEADVLGPIFTKARLLVLTLPPTLKDQSPAWPVITDSGVRPEKKEKVGSAFGLDQFPKPGGLLAGEGTGYIPNPIRHLAPPTPYGKPVPQQPQEPIIGADLEHRVPCSGIGIALGGHLLVGLCQS